MNEESSSGGSGRRNPERGLHAAVAHMQANKVEALLWLTRLGTCVFTLLCILPLFGVKPYSCYQRALLCNAATSALRLHQRMPRVEFTRAFGAMLLLEDSCHYLLYSLLFIYSYPVTMALLPIFLYAVLHSVNYSLAILNKLGYTDTWLTRLLTSIIDRHQRNILKSVALSEIILLPLTVFMVFTRGSLLLPFAYYRFLTFRYASRRNPYTRNVFHELRLMLENFANVPGRPESIRNLCWKIISTVSWLAPPIPPTH